MVLRTPFRNAIILVPLCADHRAQSAACDPDAEGVHKPGVLGVCCAGFDHGSLRFISLRIMTNSKLPVKPSNITAPGSLDVDQIRSIINSLNLLAEQEEGMFLFSFPKLFVLFLTFVTRQGHVGGSWHPSAFS